MYRRRGATALAGFAAAVAVLAGCTPHDATHRAAPPVRSALSGGLRTCTDPGAVCGRSGALRWVLPLTGTYRVDRPDRSSPGSITPVAHDEDGDGLSLVASGETVFLQAGERVLAVEVATGRVRWRHVAPGTAGYALTMLGGRVVYEQKAPNTPFRPVPLPRPEDRLGPADPRARE